jgi:hypothetical protein
MDWKQYEKEIYDYFSDSFPEAQISHDVTEIGLYSKVKRQIDVLIEQHVAGNRILVVVDGKYFNKKVDVKGVEQFIGMLEDLGAHKGLMISKEGFSEAALNRAHFGPSKVELDILNFEDTEIFQGFAAIPYAGKNGAMIQAPFGWVIDNRRAEAWNAIMYQQGFTLDNAFDNHELIYINFWDRAKDNEDLQDLLDSQEKCFRESDPDIKIEYRSTVKRNDGQTKLRIAYVNGYPGPEYSAFIEFEEYIFFAVLLTPENRSKQNLRKLENIIRTLVKVQVEVKK